DEPSTLAVTLYVADKPAADKAIADRMAVAQGTLFARRLVTEPPNVLGPVEFAAEIQKLAEIGVGIEVLGPEEMRALGMNALLAVAQGSARPARLGIMRWQGGAPGDAPLAFIGKGVCFDSGGLSIKSAAGMEDMKGVIGLVENMVDATSFRPGDIIRAMSGTTIEINNTDAEGRLVLADALWYTQ